ncbi:MAG: sigma-70 family RNA polymerase sigma factor [Myxococcota bacterium]
MGSPTDDDDLVSRALAGERSARRQLADRLIDCIQREVAICLLRVAGGTGRDPRQEVRDLVHDVVVGLLEGDGRELRRWDPKRGRSLDSFVRLVARRRVARVLGQRRGNPWAMPSMDPHDIEQDDDTALVRRLEERQQLDMLLVALQGRMNERDHELFELLYVQQVGPEEAANRMDMTRGAVNAWCYRTRKLARQIMTERSVAGGTGAAARKGTMNHGR